MQFNAWPESTNLNNPNPGRIRGAGNCLTCAQNPRTERKTKMIGLIQERADEDARKFLKAKGTIMRSLF